MGIITVLDLSIKVDLPDLLPLEDGVIGQLVNFAADVWNSLVISLR